MDYEKKYKDALERARNIRFGNPNSATANVVCEDIFPELIVSEDERIIKEILSIVKSYRENCITEGNHRFDDCIAWLEKQGGRNSTPKFKVGDWVVFNNDYDSIYQVEKIENYEYTLRHILGGSMCLSFSHENMIRAWTIQDAKEGDVLAFNNGHIIFVKESRNSTWGWRLSCWCHLLEGEFEVVEYHTKTEGLHPATKGQRDLLFSKMKEAGFEWDANKKELKKIEKNPAWSEDDELNLKQAIYVCHQNEYTPQPHWKPTEEQMSCFKQAIDLFKMKVNDDLVLRNLNSLYENLKNFEL